MFRFNSYKIVVAKKNDFEGVFELKPLEPGYGVTLGNVLRRVLLSSLEGYAVMGVRIGGVNHEFATIPGVLEDITDLILNLKQVRLKKIVDIELDFEKVTVSLRNKKVFTAGMLEEFTGAFSVANPDLVICRLDPDVELEMEIAISKGRGYVPAEENCNKEVRDAQFIVTDAIYTPIKNVAYEVKNTRVGQNTDYEELVLKIDTDGTVHPEFALKEAAKILVQYLKTINDDVPDFEQNEVSSVSNEDDEKKQQLRKILKTPLEDLELSVRAYNCLRSAEIHSLVDLVRYRSEDLMKFRNFGQKSRVEIEKMLRDRGLYFGMDLTFLKDN